MPDWLAALVHVNSRPGYPERSAFPCRTLFEPVALKHFALTTAVTLLVAMATGIAAVALNDWFGSSDLRPYAVYSTAFALLAAPASSMVYKCTKRLQVSMAAACAFIFGLIFGLAGTCAVALLLGPWMGAMSVPILQSWCITGALVFSAAVLLKRLPFSRHLLIGLLVLAFASVFAILGFRPAISLAFGNQHLTVFFYRHVPGDTELDVSDAIRDLDATDIDVLRQTGLRGKLESRGHFASNSTEWPRAKALIVYTTPIATESALPQPKHCTIAYVQDDTGFRPVPIDSPTFGRMMRIEPRPSGAGIVVEQASGGRSGGQIEP
jgi:hypothetical protein